MAQMSPVNADGLSIAEAAHVVPDHFFISKRRPSMSLTLLYESLYCAASWSDEQGFPRHAVVIGHLTLSFYLVDPVFGEGVTGMLCVMSVETANAVRSCNVTAVTQIRLYGLFGGAMRLLTHY